MVKLALRTRAGWSQQGLFLWGIGGLSLISLSLLIIEESPGHKGTSVLSRVNIDLIFFLSLDHSCRLTGHWNILFQGLPRWGVETWRKCFSFYLEQCTRCLCAQTKPIKPNQTRTSPAGSHTPIQAKGPGNAQKSKAKWQECPPKWQSDAQKSKAAGINATWDFSILLDLRPGSISTSSLF